MARQGTGKNTVKAALITRKVHKILVLLLSTLWLVSCSGALPGSQRLLAISDLPYSAASGTTAKKLLIIQTNLPTGTVNNPYSGSILASGGTAPYSFGLISGALPSGLSFDPDTGFVTGTPTLAGTSNFKFEVDDSAGNILRSHGQIVINAPAISTAGPTITVTVSPTSATLISGTSLQFSGAIQGTSNTAVTWSASAGSISSNGVFTAPAVSSNTNVTITASSAANGAQSSATVAVSPPPRVASNPPVITTTSLPTATMGAQYSSAFAVSGGTAPYTWSATNISPGLTVSSAGAISGIPSGAGSYTIAAHVTDSNNTTASQNVSLSVTSPTSPPSPPPPLAISTTSLPMGTVSFPYSATLAAGGGSPPYTWTATGLPNGLVLSSSGTIAGTPTTATSSTTVSVQLTDSANVTANQNFAMTVNAGPAQSGTPALPQIFIDTTFPNTAGYAVKTVAAACPADYCPGNAARHQTLQDALNGEACGTILKLHAGDSFIKSGLLLPGAVTAGSVPIKQCDAQHWFILMSDDCAADGTCTHLPNQGTRTSPSLAPYMPKVITPDTTPAIAPAFGAAYYWFLGLEITKQHCTTCGQYADLSYGLIDLAKDYGSGLPLTVDQLSKHITFDRNYMHGDYSAPSGETYRGCRCDGQYIALVDNYISNIHDPVIEVQGIEHINGPGPEKIVNNYVEASGENIMWGGGDPWISGTPLPGDIEVRHNYLAKPLTWNPYDSRFAGVNYSVKNLMELKNAQRVLVDSNIFENNWVAAQSGYAIVFTPRNQNGGCTWCNLTDVTFTNNIVRHSASAFNILAVDYNHPSGELSRLSIKNNLVWDIGGTEWGTSGTGIWAGMSGSTYPGGPTCCLPILNLTFDHNTGISTKDMLEMTGAPAANYFTFTNNLNTHGSYGIYGDAVGVGNNAIATYLLSPTFGQNVLIDAPSPYNTTYPAGFLFTTSGNVGFANPTNGDYRLCHGPGTPSSTCTKASPFVGAGTDGKDIGADVVGINAATGCVVSGANCD